MWLQKLRWSDFGFQRPKSWVRTIGYAVAGTVFLHVVLSFVLAPLVINLTREPVDSSHFDLLRSNPLALAIGLLVVWTLAAFGEELVFRGYIMHAFARPFKHKGLGWVFAVFLTSILFGLGHSYQGITGVILTGAVGVLYAGSFFLCGRNLWVPILIHGLYDTSAFLFIFFNLDKALG
jgi:membrane protease YdiL (CAAX protease family)